MRDVFSEKQGSLEKMLSNAALTPEQKAAMLEAMEFGYAAAFCESRCDMNGSSFQAQRYKDSYDSIKEKLQKSD